MKKFIHILLFLTLSLSVGGQVLAIPVTCAMPNMVMPMEGSMNGGMSDMDMERVVADTDEASSSQTSHCEQICNYCLSYSSLVHPGAVLPDIMGPAADAGYTSFFILSSRLDTPYRPPILA